MDKQRWCNKIRTAFYSSDIESIDGFTNKIGGVKSMSGLGKKEQGLKQQFEVHNIKASFDEHQRKHYLIIALRKWLNEFASMKRNIPSLHKNKMQIHCREKLFLLKPVV